MEQRRLEEKNNASNNLGEFLWEWQTPSGYFCVNIFVGINYDCREEQ
jgi:hypothetical protein